MIGVIDTEKAGRATRIAPCGSFSFVLPCQRVNCGRARAGRSLFMDSEKQRFKKSCLVSCFFAAAAKWMNKSLVAPARYPRPPHYWGKTFRACKGRLNLETQRNALLFPEFCNFCKTASRLAYHFTFVKRQAQITGQKCPSPGKTTRPGNCYNMLRRSGVGMFGRSGIRPLSDNSRDLSAKQVTPNTGTRNTQTPERPNTRQALPERRCRTCVCGV